MTTDTRAKQASSTRDGFTVGGMTKGSGMIHPELATMLAVVTTDYPLRAARRSSSSDRRSSELQRDLGRRRALDERLRHPARQRGERRRGARRATPSSPRRSAEVCAELARQVVADGEGITVLAEITVSGAARRRPGAGDRAPDRDLATRQDRALRTRRQLGPGADGGGQRAVERRLRRHRRRRGPPRYNGTLVFDRGPRPTSSPTSPGPPARSSSSSASARAAPATSPPTSPTTTSASTRTTGHEHGSSSSSAAGSPMHRRAARRELARTGYALCVVHGAGPQISARDGAGGIPGRVRSDGRRVTTRRRSRSCRVAARRQRRRSARRSATARWPLGRRDRPRGRAGRRGSAWSATRIPSPPAGTLDALAARTGAGRLAARAGPAERQRRRGGRRAGGRPRRRAAALPHRRRRADPRGRVVDADRARGGARTCSRAARSQAASSRSSAAAHRRRRGGVPAVDRANGGGGMNVLTGAPLLPTYARFPVTFVDGEGCWLIADDGQRYLDLVAGIAVVSLGHCHPAPLAAAHAQLERLWHVSNLYSTEPMERLARALSRPLRRRPRLLLQLRHRGGRGRRSSGRARRPGRPEFVALEGSFHGRTMGAPR